MFFIKHSCFILIFIPKYPRKGNISQRWTSNYVKIQVCWSVTLLFGTHFTTFRKHYDPLNDGNYLLATRPKIPKDFILQQQCCENSKYPIQLVLNSWAKYLNFRKHKGIFRTYFAKELCVLFVFFCCFFVGVGV